MNVWSNARTGSCQLVMVPGRSSVSFPPCEEMLDYSPPSALMSRSGFNSSGSMASRIVGFSQKWRVAVHFLLANGKVVTGGCFSKALLVPGFSSRGGVRLEIPVKHPRYHLLRFQPTPALFEREKQNYHGAGNIYSCGPVSPLVSFGLN